MPKSELFGCYGDRIEEAKSHGLLGFGVVTGRADDGETVPNLAHGSCPKIILTIINLLLSLRFLAFLDTNVLLQGIMTVSMITLKGQIDDAAGSHPGGGRRVDVVPGRVRVDADAAARQHDEILHGQFGEAIDVHLGTVHGFRAKEHRVDVRVDRLELLGRGLARAEPQAAVDGSSLLETGPDALQAAAVLRVGAVAAAHALVSQHEAVVGQRGAGAARLGTAGRRTPSGCRQSHGHHSGSALACSGRASTGWVEGDQRTGKCPRQRPGDMMATWNKGRTWGRGAELKF